MFDILDSELIFPEDFGRNYLFALERRGGALAGRILLYSYLRIYPRGLPYWEPLRATLSRLLTRGSSTAARYRYTNLSQILLAQNGPQLLAQHLLHTDPGRYLRKLGLIGELARGRFIEETWESLAVILTKGEFSDSTIATRVFLALSLESNSAALRFPKRLTELAQGLLTPWIGRGMDFPLGIRNLLSTHLGDPRPPSVVWEGVSPTARAVLRQSWAGTAIEDFFLILESLALHDPGINPHRHERRAWWWSAWKRGMVTDAWVALGSAVPPTPPSPTRYATIGGRVRHSALLIITSGMTVVEWSNSATDLLWYPQNPAVPQLYKPHYNPEELARSVDRSVSGSEIARLCE